MSLFGASKLPPISPSARELLSISLEDAKAEQRLVQICSAEPQLSVRIVAIANSVVYRRGGAEVFDVLQAIRRIGLERTKQLATAMLFGQQLTGYLPPGFGESFWLHSLTMAAAAQEIAQIKGYADTGAAYLAGLIHDLGYMVQEVAKAGSIEQAVAAAIADRLAPEAAEQQEWGTNHAKLTAELLAYWHAPANLAAALGEHHGDHIEPKTLAAVVRGAEHLARLKDLGEVLYAGRQHPFAPLSLDRVPLVSLLSVQLGLKPEQVDELVRRVIGQVEGVRDAARAIAGKR